MKYLLKCYVLVFLEDYFKENLIFCCFIFYYLKLYSFVFCYNMIIMMICNDLYILIFVLNFVFYFSVEEDLRVGEVMNVLKIFYSDGYILKRK